MTISPPAVLQPPGNASAEFLPKSLELEAIRPGIGQTLLGTLARVNAENYQIALVPLHSARERNRNEGWTTKVEGALFLPFTWEELLKRVSTEMGGSHSTRPDEIAYFGQVRINLLSMEVARANRLVKLTAMEFKVLRFFLFNRNRVISRDELLNEVWGYENYPCTRTVDNHVLKLRQKLERDPSQPVHFRTAHGMGYRFVP